MAYFIIFLEAHEDFVISVFRQKVVLEGCVGILSCPEVLNFTFVIYFIRAFYDVAVSIYTLLSVFVLDVCIPVV